MKDARSQLQAALGAAYVFERELGGGGMARVFLARDAAGRKVVVKAVPPDLWIGVDVRHFCRQVELLAALQHPLLVPLLGAGQAGDFLYYTMPFVAGESVRAKLQREGAMPLPEAVRLMRDVAAALAHAHRHGVVHRDIKPEHILLAAGRALVSDCGVAQALGSGSGPGPLTSARLALGTPAYMAPEQLSGGAATDRRADVYALGALAYEVLTGNPPFRGGSPHAVLAAHGAERPVPVVQRRPEMPRALAELVTRCLEKHPADRPQSAEDVLAALDALDQPGAGLPPKGLVQRVKSLLAALRRAP
ncbi:MAG TPA: serine/threonine-protein kinase [Gemmatimonadales bacterium]|nr:serine/threonine-protein kinase [Gemmatimonadales bacterium]